MALGQLAQVFDLTVEDDHSYLCCGVYSHNSSQPNLQNIPKYLCRFPEADIPGWNIKRLFVPDEGKVWWQLDIAAAEIRVLCAYAKDPDLINALIDGLDIHSFVAAEVFGMDYEEVLRLKDIDQSVALKRTATKRVVFGTLYGAGPVKIAEQIFGTLSTIPEEEERQIAFAKEVSDKVFSRFRQVSKYVSGTQYDVRRHQMVETYFGRRRRFDLATAHRRILGQAKRQAVNFKIQSTASDILISQLVELAPRLDDLDATFQLTVHDSLCGSVPWKNVSQLEDFFDYYIVDRVKEKFDWLPVPFAYDLEVGINYGDVIAYDKLTAPDDKLKPSEKHVRDTLEQTYGAYDLPRRAS